MTSAIAKADLVFVHLSDIHFRKGRAGDSHDENEMLRNELEFDLRRLRTRLPRFDGLIVSGDIAFSGKPEEYEYAGGWIGSIRELLGCIYRGIWRPGTNVLVSYEELCIYLWIVDGLLTSSPPHL